MSPHFGPWSASSRKPGRESPHLPADALEAWYQQYIAQDGGSIWPGSAVIRAVESDVLDYEQIEAQVQHLIPTAGVVDGFCASCQQMLDHWPSMTSAVDKEGVVGRHFHTNEMDAAARLGCRFCAFLLGRLEHASLLSTFLKIEARLRNIGDNGTIALSIVKAEEWAHGGLVLWLNFPGKLARHLNDNGATAVLFISHTLPPSAKLWQHPVEDPFETARTWLARCIKSHECCRSKRQYRTPSRLILIGHGIVKLVITASLPETPRYATLSYCWGREPFTTLTRDNLDLFLDHIPLEGLSQTFIDAISSSRQLGMDYIWIDALCIIQKEENNSDWANEAGHMAAIYGGTYVNLAVSTAASVAEGFLHCLKPKQRNLGFVAQVTDSGGCRVEAFHSITAYEESTTETYLATRAWTLQERLLSPRTIYFGKTGLFWVCRTHLGSELAPDEVPIISGRSPTIAEDVPFHWGEIATQYSGAKLTYSSDRLPALSGIANRQQKLTNDQYLAGMWRESLITQLQWKMVGKKSRRPEWRAPTWSWTSVDGRVSRLEFESWNSYIEVVDACTTPAGPDPYGAVAGGELIISCTHLIRVHIQTDEDMGSLTDEILRTRLGPRSFRVTIDCLEEVSSQKYVTIYLLPVLEGDMEGFANTSDQVLTRLTLHGLILRAFSGSNELNRFQRIGSFYFRKQVDCARDKDFYQALMDALNREGSLVHTTDVAQTASALGNQAGRLLIAIE